MTMQAVPRSQDDPLIGVAMKLDEYGFFFDAAVARNSVKRIEALQEQVARLTDAWRAMNELQAAEWRRAEAAEADARRYRWLRRFDHFAIVDAMLNTTEYNTLDAAIDAAMAKGA